MLKCLFPAGTPLGDFWAQLEAVAQGSTFGPDRTVARNVVYDPCLADPGFAGRLAPAVVADITTFFEQWAAACNGGTGLHAACEAVFSRAYKAIKAARAAGQVVNFSAPGNACLRLAMLGFDTARLSGQHCGEWVSFLLYTVPSEHDSVGGRGDDPKAGATFYSRLERMTEAVVREFTSRSYRWFACTDTLQPLLNGSPLGAKGLPKFDAVRDLLGLVWRSDNRYVFGVTASTLQHAPLGRVPTFFDSAGFEYFRPASTTWFQQYHCGCTCPIHIDNMKPPGVAELIAWVAAEPPPAHAGPANAARPDLAVLKDSAGQVCVFAIEDDPNTANYHARRG